MPMQSSVFLRTRALEYCFVACCSHGPGCQFLLFNSFIYVAATLWQLFSISVIPSFFLFCGFEMRVRRTAVKKRQLRKMASVRDGMVTAHVPWSVTCSCMHANASHKLTKIVFAFGENIFDSLWRLARFA